MKVRLRNRLAAVGGVLLALSLLELTLRPLASGDLPPIARPRADALDLPAVTSRQLEEGIAESHFSRAGSRLTGNPVVAGGPVIVILGDSHVAAREVSDAETMGAWVERLARLNHYPVNVRQYGWRGASPPQYLVEAKDVLERWHPTDVVIIVDGDDLGADPLNRRYPRMRIAGDDSVEIIDAPPTTKTPAVPHHESTLATLFRIRWQLVIERAPRSLRYWLHAPVEQRGPTPDSATLAEVPRAEVKALARAFGPRLLIVYTADVRATGGEKTDGGERRLLAACAQLQVRCLSMRQQMLAARKEGLVVRGFSTTTLGVGHLNAAGHELVGRSIWNEIQRREAPSTSQLAQR